MSNYRRFITYLFRYENGEKKEQCGYARVELQQSLGKIEFHIKNCKANGGEILPCFFAESGQVRIPIGKIGIKGQAGEGVFRFDGDSMVAQGDESGRKYLFQELRGLVIPLDEGQLIVSQWDDGTYSWEKLVGWQENRSNVENHLDGNHDTVHEMARDEARLGTEEDKTMMEDVVKKEAIVEDPAVAEVADTEDIEETESVEPKTEEPAVQPLHNLQNSRPRVYPFDGDRSVWAVQAQLRDIKHLPRECWPLGNNSFVLRGYCRYGNILIGYMEKEQAYFLGIPGVFHRQERVIASMFGFEHFRGKSSEEEKSGHFGYWYKVLDVVS